MIESMLAKLEEVRHNLDKDIHYTMDDMPAHVHDDPVYESLRHRLQTTFIELDPILDYAEDCLKRTLTLMEEFNDA